MNNRKRNPENMASPPSQPSSPSKKPKLASPSHSSSQVPSIEETANNAGMKNLTASEFRELAEFFAAQEPLPETKPKPRRKSTGKRKTPVDPTSAKGNVLYSFYRFQGQHKAGRRFEAEKIKKKLGELPPYLLAWHYICNDVWPEEMQVPWLYLNRATQNLSKGQNFPETYNSHNLDPNSKHSILYYDHDLNKFGLLCKQYFAETPFSGISSVRTLWKAVEGKPILVGYEIKKIKPQCKPDALYVTQKDNSYYYSILKPGSRREFFTGNLDSIVRPSESKNLNELLPRILELTAKRGHTATYPFLPEANDSPFTSDVVAKCQALIENEALALRINQNPSQWREILLGQMTDTAETGSTLSRSESNSNSSSSSHSNDDTSSSSSLSLSSSPTTQPAPMEIDSGATGGTSSSSAYMMQALSENESASAHSHSHSSSHSNAASAPVARKIPSIPPSSPPKGGFFQYESCSSPQQQTLRNPGSPIKRSFRILGSRTKT